MQTNDPKNENIFSYKPLPAINERVKSLVDYFANGSVKRFSEVINLSSSQKLNRIFNIDKRNEEYPEVSSDILLSIANMFPEVNLKWLMTGIGDMLISKESDVQIIHNPIYTERLIEDQDVFLYDIYAAANLKTLFLNKDQNILGKISIPNIPACDGAVYINGDSMYPLLKSGDIIAYKEIRSLENILYGEMYLISFDMDGDEFLTVKYINKSDVDGCIKLVSYNSHHDPKDIPLKSINALGLVKLSIRKNTMI